MKNISLVVTTLILCVWHSTSWAAIALVNRTSCTNYAFGATSPLACTIPSTSSGDLIVVTIGEDDTSAGGITGVTDGAAHSFSQAYGGVAGTFNVAQYYFCGESAGVTTINVAENGSGSNRTSVFEVWEFSGVLTSSCLDVVSSLQSISSNASLTTGTATSSIAGDLGVGNCMLRAGGVNTTTITSILNNYTSPAGIVATSGDATLGEWGAYNLSAGAGTSTGGTWSVSNSNAGCAIATYKASLVAPMAGAVILLN